MEPIPYTVDAGPFGPTKVVLGDVDVTEMISGFSLVAQEGAPPRLHLGLKPGESAEPLTGLGVVVVQPAQGDLDAFLANIDRDALADEALRRDGQPIHEAVTVLREWAKAAGA